MAQPSRSYRRLALRTVIGLVILATGCTKLTFHPTPVVPTKSSLPYTAQVQLTELAAHMVEPGATLLANPNLQDSVTQATSVPGLSAQEWTASITDYVAARQTFRKVVEGGRTDVIVALRIFLYIDPGLEFKFNHTYMAKTDAVLKDPHSGRILATYTGLGKAFGLVYRGSREDDEGPINKSVQAALNDMFGKLETDKRILP
ncbi:MAG: hypothetical protein OJF47_001885 [Nitrospira sp.]|jgi:hypothetical protein|nr:MAG: hypothetical protein OJF47_001885 [Nitrospira sp.]